MKEEEENNEATQSQENEENKEPIEIDLDEPLTSEKIFNALSLIEKNSLEILPEEIQKKLNTIKKM